MLRRVSALTVAIVVTGLWACGSGSDGQSTTTGAGGDGAGTSVGGAGGDGGSGGATDCFGTSVQCGSTCCDTGEVCFEGACSADCGWRAAMR